MHTWSLLGCRPIILLIQVADSDKIQDTNRNAYIKATGEKYMPGKREGPRLARHVSVQEWALSFEGWVTSDTCLESWHSVCVNWSRNSILLRLFSALLCASDCGFGRSNLIFIRINIHNAGATVRFARVY